jgi:hypothetical protein
VVGTSTYPSIPSTTVNVMRPKRPSWTSPLAKCNRPRPLSAYTIYQILHHAGFYSLVFQIEVVEIIYNMHMVNCPVVV